MDHGRLDNQAECLIVVDAFLLGEVADNPTCLMPSEGAVGVELMFEKPCASDNVCTRQSRYEAPSTVVDQCLVLVRHRSALIRISKGTTIVRWEGLGDKGMTLKRWTVWRESVYERVIGQGHCSSGWPIRWSSRGQCWWSCWCCWRCSSHRSHRLGGRCYWS